MNSQMSLTDTLTDTLTQAKKKATAEATSYTDAAARNKKSTATLRPLELIFGTAWPLLLYVCIFRMQIGWLRWEQPVVLFLITLGLPVVLSLIWAFKNYKDLRAGRPIVRWLLIMNVTMLITIPIASVFAEHTFLTFSQPYFDYEAMASYVNVDPSVDRGQTYMDAGQIYFRENARVDTHRAIAYQDGDIYCIAPIILENLHDDDVGRGHSEGHAATSPHSKTGHQLPPSGTVDFWAVGMNCCEPSGLHFKCGETLNPLARSGLRVVRHDVRPFYVLAVQEWSAWLHLPSKHPIFLHWVEDPLLQVDNLWLQSLSSFYLNTFLCFVSLLTGNIFLHFLLVKVGF